MFLYFTVKSKKGPPKYVVDTTYLGCDHHVYMGVGVSLALKTAINAGNILIIGLGGGGLCTYLHSCFKQVDLFFSFRILFSYYLYLHIDHFYCCLILGKN